MKKKTMHPHVREKDPLVKHHRRPRAQGGRNFKTHNGLGNVVEVPLSQHIGWHSFAHGLDTPEEICARINLFCDPDYYFVVRYTKGRKP